MRICANCKWVAKKKDMYNTRKTEVWTKRVKAYSDECIKKWGLAIDGYVTYVFCKKRPAYVPIEFASLCEYYEEDEKYE